MAQGCAEISVGLHRIYRLKCFEDYFPGISALLDRAEHGDTRTMGEKERQAEMVREEDRMGGKATGVCVSYTFYFG